MVYFLQFEDKKTFVRVAEFHAVIMALLILPCLPTGYMYSSSPSRKRLSLPDMTESAQ